MTPVVISYLVCGEDVLSGDGAAGERACSKSRDASLGRGIPETRSTSACCTILSPSPARRNTRNLSKTPAITSSDSMLLGAFALSCSGRASFSRGWQGCTREKLEPT